MKILLLGVPLFRGELERLGHSVVTAGVTGSRDMEFPSGDFSVKNALSRMGPENRPDVCLFVEELANRRFPEGLEELPCPLVFYSIDTHLNYFWTRHMARTCDAVLTTQRDFVDLLRKECGEVHWLPWGNDPAEYTDLGLERDLDVTFVGSVCSAYRPRRKNLLDLVGSRFPLTIISPSKEKWFSPAEIARIYSRSKIVLNEAVHREVNFRVFEAMAAGAMLLTEKVENGLPELFVDGEHLATFTPFDLLRKLEYFLAHPEERNRIASRGKREVEERHTRLERARSVAAVLGNTVKRTSVPGRARQGSLGRTYYLMLRSGRIGNPEDFTRTGKLLASASAGEPVGGHHHGDLAEFCDHCGLREKALEYYARGWKAGERGFRIASLWGLRLLAEGKEAEARALFLHAAGLDFPEEVRRGLRAAAEGPLPSTDLYLWLARAAECGEDSFCPGFCSTDSNRVPLAGPDFLEEGMKLDPKDGRLYLELAEIGWRNRMPHFAGMNFLLALRFGCDSAENYRKAATALHGAFRPGEAIDLLRLAIDRGLEREPMTLMEQIKDSIGISEAPSGS